MLKMFPVPSMSQKPDATLTDSILSRQIGATTSRFKGFKDGACVQFGKLRMGGFFTTSSSRPSTSLFISIFRVFFRSSEKQMVWVYTRRVIATMADKHSLRNGAVVKHIGSAMRPNTSCKKTLLQSAISLFINASKPQPAPTVVSLEKHFLPKSGSCGGGQALRREVIRSIVIAHNKSVMLCHAPGWFHNAGAFCLSIVRKGIKACHIHW